MARVIFGNGVSLTLANDFEPNQRGWSKCIGQSNIGSIAASRHQYAPGSGRIVPRIEGLPATAQKSLEPGAEIHRRIGRRQTDIADVSAAVTRRNIHRAT
jgi:hypothetical protein